MVHSLHKGKPQTKTLSASAKALKLCSQLCKNMMSFETLYDVNRRATPNNLMLNKHALVLYKSHGFRMALNEYQMLTSRHTKLKFWRGCTCKICINEQLVQLLPVWCLCTDRIVSLWEGLIVFLSVHMKGQFTLTEWMNE